MGIGFVGVSVGLASANTDDYDGKLDIDKKWRWIWKNGAETYDDSDDRGTLYKRQCEEMHLEVRKENAPYLRG